MIEKPMDVLQNYEVRKSKTQKSAFIAAVLQYTAGLGYEGRVEEGKQGSRNIVLGDPEQAKYLVTAHYDTPAGMLIPNMITPCNPVTFIAYQLFVVAIFFAVAFAVGIPVWWLTQNEAAGFLAGYIVYFGLLILMLRGPANKHNANDNTSGVVTLLEIAASMPENLRDRVCFVLFDLEEAGLVGSASYRKAHKAATENQIVMNMDCVGDGDHIVLFPMKKTKKNDAVMAALRNLEGRFGAKTIAVREKGFAHYPSDQRNFPLGVGVAAFRSKKGVGLYCSRIHTARDTVLEQTNVNILRAAIISLMTHN